MMPSFMGLVSKGCRREKPTFLSKTSNLNHYRDKERVIEYFIDNLLFIQHKNYRFILGLFENNFARVLDADTLDIVQEIQFKSDYALPSTHYKSIVGGAMLEKV